MTKRPSQHARILATPTTQPQRWQKTANPKKLRKTETTNGTRGVHLCPINTNERGGDVLVAFASAFS
jgi:hypothetical protein